MFFYSKVLMYISRNQRNMWLTLCILSCLVFNHIYWSYELSFTKLIDFVVHVMINAELEYVWCFLINCYNHLSWYSILHYIRPITTIITTTFDFLSNETYVFVSFIPFPDLFIRQSVLIEIIKTYIGHNKVDCMNK